MVHDLFFAAAAALVADRPGAGFPLRFDLVSAALGFLVCGTSEGGLT